MEKYLVRFAHLVLFFVVFMSGVAINMETDVLLKNPTLMLKSVLNDVENNPRQLMSRTEANSLSGIFWYVTNYFEQPYTSKNNIDYVITLIEAGADSNAENYNGNTVLHLLISNFLQVDYLKYNDVEFQALRAKIELLSKYNVDFNAINGEGNTIGHILMTSCMNKAYYSKDTIQFIMFLVSLGMSVNVKNNVGCTAYDMGKKIIDDRFGGSYQDSTTRNWSDSLYCTIVNQLVILSAQDALVRLINVEKRIVVLKK